MADELADYVDELRGDDRVLGLLLHGSRAVGLESAGSDYDLICVISDEAYDERKREGALLARRDLRGGSTADVFYESPGNLRRLAERPDSYTATYETARILLDKTGELAGLVARIGASGGAAAAARVREDYDAYLNSWVRSLKAWRRGDELGGRLHAAASVYSLLWVLFGLELRWPPYHDQLEARLAELEDAQGWERGELRGSIIELLTTGAPGAQQRLEARVEALLRSRGFEHEWGEDLEPLKRLRL
jgi:predicted nucleotidyltransferase